MNRRNSIFYFTLVLLLCSLSCFSNTATAVGGKDDYKGVVPYHEGLIAVTNNGRIDWLTQDGNMLRKKAMPGHQFTGILVADSHIVLSESSGLVILNTTDTTLQKVTLPTAKAVYCMSYFKGLLVVGVEGGALNVGKLSGSFQSVFMQLKGNVVALSAHHSKCYGVTDQGEIIQSSDGINWQVFDFNAVYKGYYKSCSFTGIFATANQIALVGKNIDGNPVLYFSNKGNIWTERPLIYEDESGRRMNLEHAIHDIYYEQTFDQFILATESGQLMTIPSCSHCHKVYELAEKKLNSVLGAGEVIIVAGEDGFIKIINVEYL